MSETVNLLSYNNALSIADANGADRDLEIYGPLIEWTSINASISIVSTPYILPSFYTIKITPTNTNVILLRLLNQYIPGTNDRPLSEISYLSHSLVSSNVELEVSGELKITSPISSSVKISSATTSTVVDRFNAVRTGSILLKRGKTAQITNAVGTGSAVTFTGFNTFSIGDVIRTHGISPNTYELNGVTVTSATSNTFTVASTATGSYSATLSDGYAYITSETDTGSSPFLKYSGEDVSCDITYTIGGHSLNSEIYFTFPVLIDELAFQREWSVRSTNTVMPQVYKDIDSTSAPSYPLAKLTSALMTNVNNISELYAQLFRYDLSEIPAYADGTEKFIYSELVDRQSVTAANRRWLGQFTGRRLIDNIYARDFSDGAITTWEDSQYDFHQWQLENRYFGTKAGSLEAVRETVSRYLTGNKFIAFSNQGSFNIKIQTLFTETLGISGDAVNITSVRYNLITNPSFETNTTGWSSAQSPAVRSTDFNLRGTASYKITCSSTIDTNIAVVSPTFLTTGVHTFSMYVYIPVGSILAGRTVSVDREGGTATVLAVSQSNATLVAGSWVRLSTTKNVTATGNITLVARLSGSMNTVSPRRNLIINPSFEVDLIGWNITGTNARNTVEFFTGIASLSMSYTSAATVLATQTTRIACNVGASYTASFYLKQSVDTGLVVCNFMWYNSAGTLVLDDTHQSNDPNTSWQRFSQTRVCPATAVTFALRIYQESGEGGGATSTINYLDAVLIEESATLGSYFDGSSNGGTWTGTANNSTSTLPRINLCPNPSFETNTTSWSPFVSSLTRVAGTITGGTGSYSATSVASSTASYGPFFQYSTPTEGTSLTVSAYCLRTVGTRSYRWDMQFYNGATLLSVASGTSSTCATSTRLSVTGTVPAGTTNVLIILTSTGTGAISDAHQIDSVLLEESSTLNTYFDGSTSATEAAWTGTAHASTSTYVPKIYVDAALLEQSSTAGVYFDGSRQYATEAIHSYIPGDIVYVGCVDSAGTSSSDWSISGATVSATKGTNIAISSASYSSFYATTTYNTSSPHYFNNGDTVAVTGITPSSWNRTATITVTSSTSFFFLLFNGSTGGAYSSGGIAKTLIPSFEVNTAATASTSGITGTAKPLIKVTAVDDGADINGSAIPGYVRYTAANTFSAGDKVSFVGTVGTFNVNDATIVAATATHFVIASALTGSTTTGYAHASSSPLVLAAVEQTRPMGMNYTSQVVLDFTKFTFDNATTGIIDTSRLG
jgi:hypothetical protein